MTLDKQVLAKLAFEPGDRLELAQIWVTVSKTIDAYPHRLPEMTLVARMAFNQAYMEHGIKGPLATTALAAVGL